MTVDPPVRLRIVCVLPIFVFAASCEKVRSSRYLSDQEFDFGSVAAGTVVTHKFELWNPTKEPIGISAIKGSCACTAASDSPELIEPKSAVGIVLTLRTDTKSGPVQEHVQVRLGDGQLVRLGFVGEVVAEQVARVDFGDVRRGESNRRTIRLPWPERRPLEIVGLGYSPDYFEVKAEESRETRSHNIIISLRGDVPYGSFAKSLLIETDDTVLPRRTVAVRGNVLDVLMADPRQIALGSLIPGRRKEGKCRLYSPYGEIIKIHGVNQVRGEEVAWEIRPLSAAAAELIVSAQPAADSTDPVVVSELEVTGHAAGEDARVRVEVYGIILHNSSSQELVDPGHDGDRFQ